MQDGVFLTCKEKILSEQYIDIIEAEVTSGDLTTGFQDYCVQNVTDNIVNIYINVDEIAGIFPEAEQFSLLPRCYGIVSDNQLNRLSREPFNYLPLSDTGILDIQKPPLSLTGQGVLVAVIDTGIDYQNPLFRNEDGSTRIRAIWDQTLQTGTSPQKFDYGTEFREDDINMALQQENPLTYVNTVDEIGHGTCLASVMAGSGGVFDVNYTSPAPEAGILVVKLKQAKEYLRQLYLIPEGVPCYQENDIMTAIAYVRSFVEVTRQPVVICLGLGSSMGNHAGNAILDTMIAEVSNIRNFCVVACGGDEGNEQHHYAGGIQAGDLLAQEVELNVEAGNQGFFMEFWAEEPAVFQIAVRSPAGETTGLINNKNGRDITYSFVYGESSLQVNYVLAEDYSGWQGVFLRWVRPTAGIWTIEVVPQEVGVELRYHIWLPIRAFLQRETTQEGSAYFIRSSPYETLTAPVPYRGIIVVSGYNNFENGVYLDSSRGFTTDGRISPDLCAPAVGLSTPYGPVDGTDFAAALTAGAAAQMLQWGVIQKKDIFMDDKEVRNYLIRGTTKRKDQSYPNPAMGYGVLNMVTAFEKIAAY
ncbi:MAG: S8 family peptidase [Lachnospiraceae bacterium]|nr:S8 family peptidase [Lachnospiraceae bacterium]